MPAQHISNKVDVPTFDQIVLYTGNVLHKIAYDQHGKLWNKKSNKELIDAISDTLYGSIDDRNTPSFKYDSESRRLEVPNLKAMNGISPEERNNVEVTAKLFHLDPTSYSKSHIDTAIQQLQKLLNVSSIDTFIVSLDKKESIHEAWKDLEDHHENGTIHKLGVSDFDYNRLNHFIHTIKVKPFVNQVYVDQCCSLPDDLIKLGKQNGIELTYNGDTTEILDTDILSSLLNNHGLIDIHTQIKPRWVLKYDVFYQHRSVLADKGYIVVGDVSA